MRMALVPPFRNFLASMMGLVTSLVFSDGVLRPLEGDLGMICNNADDWLILVLNIRNDVGDWLIKVFKHL